jgi:hypothetical protein
VEGNLLSDPQAHGLLFQLLYTGQTTLPDHKGFPIYCLVARQGNVTYLAIPQPQGIYVKWWRAPPNWTPSVKDPATAPTSWTLTPADPGGLLGSDYLETYRIKNLSHGLFLGNIISHDRDPSAMQPADGPSFFVSIRDPAVIAANHKEGADPFFNWVCTKIESAANA